MWSDARRMYLWVSLGLMGAYLWLGFQFFFNPGNQGTFTVCLWRNVTGIPCPSCGTTRSMNAFLHGHFREAAQTNPLGLSLMPLLVVLPIWILFDAWRKQNTLYTFYLRILPQITRSRVAIPLALLLLANWAWNIMKHL